MKDRLDPFKVFNDMGALLRVEEELRMPRVPRIFSINGALESDD